jgi:hypothetical protein
MKNAVFCDVAPCGSYKKTEVSEDCTTSIIWLELFSKLRTTLAVTNKRSTLLVADIFVTISPILVTMIMGGDTFLRNVASYKSPTK